MQDIPFSRQLFADLQETWVIRFHHDDAARSFTIVTDYPQRGPDSDRDFMRLVFSGVDRYKRHAGTARDRQLGDTYVCAGSFTCRLEETDLKRYDGTWWQVRLRFDGSGTIEFRCDAIRATQRGSRTELVAGTTLYSGIDGRPFTFANPFDD